MGETAVVGSCSLSGASGSESEEECYAYDLNEDGQVSLDEPLQTFQNGDSSLEAIFGEGGSVSALS